MKRTIIPILWLAFLSIFVLAACHKEKNLSPAWTYEGPRPAITDGPSEAQKLCYALYKKYDIHPYYTLSGEEALHTLLGTATSTAIRTNNAAAIPIQAATEETAVKYFSLLTKVYDLFPADIIKNGLFKRLVLVKINPGSNNYTNQNREPYFSNTYAENGQGTLYVGALKNNQDTDDKFETNLIGWKWGIVYQLFRGLATSPYKDKAIPARFANISKGLYYYETTSAEQISIRGTVFDTEIGINNGFVHPFGAMAFFENPLADWASIVAWILTESKTNRDQRMQGKYLLQEKYQLIMTFYQTNYQIDLEKLSVQLQAITLP